MWDRDTDFLCQPVPLSRTEVPAGQAESSPVCARVSPSPWVRAQVRGPAGAPRRRGLCGSPRSSRRRGPGGQRPRVPGSGQASTPCLEGQPPPVLHTVRRCP